MSERQDIERRARVVVTGLVFCAIEPPSSTDDDGDYPPMPEGGVILDAGEGPAKNARELPALPEGVFLHHFYLQSWNWRSMHVAGRDVRFEWLEAPQARSHGERAHLPGDEVPDQE